MIFLALALFIFVGTLASTGMLWWRVAVLQSSVTIDSAPVFGLFFSGMCFTVALALLALPT